MEKLFEFDLSSFDKPLEPDEKDLKPKMQENADEGYFKDLIIKMENAKNTKKKKYDDEAF